MSVLYLLIPLAVLFACGAVVFFIWAVNTQQFDDLDTPPVRILFDDNPKKPTKHSTQE
jgi:cbb3-type cytochrome oxidase maturation protein